MDLFNRLVARLMRLHHRMRRWHRILLSLAMVVVFVTTYAMILPAISLDEETTEAMPGIALDEAETEQVSEELISSGTAGADSEIPDIQEDTAAVQADPEETDLPTTTNLDETEQASADSPAEASLAYPEEGDDVAEGSADTGTETPHEEEIVEEESAPEEYIPSLFLETEDFDVLVSFKDGRGVPAGTELEFRTIDREAPGDLAYLPCYEAAFEEYLKMNAGVIRTALLYEMSFRYMGELVPADAGSMDVCISYKNNTVSHADDHVNGCLFTGAVPGSESAEPVKAWLVEKNPDGTDALTFVDDIITGLEMKAVPVANDSVLIGLFAAERAEAEDPADSDQQSSEPSDVQEDDPEAVLSEDIIAEETSADVEEAGEERVLTVVRSDYRVTVTFGADAGVPEDAQLFVAELLPEDSNTESDTLLSYDEYMEETEKVLGLDTASVSDARFFEIRIEDRDGTKVDLSAPVSVMIELQDTLERGGDAAETQAQVVHFADDAETPEVVENVQTDSQAVYFEAEGFSVYAVVPGPDPYIPEAQTVQSLAELTGENAEDGFYLSVTRNGSDQYFTNKIITSQNVYALEVTSGISGGAAWFFEPVSGTNNQFRISTLMDNPDGSQAKKYIRQRSGNTIELSDTGSVFEISSAGSGLFYIKLQGENRWLQYSNSGGGIRLWTDHNNAANSQIKMTYASSVSVPSDPYGLDGQTFGIMNYNSGITGEALMAEAKNSSALQSLSMVVRDDPKNPDGNLYVAQNSDISMWTFHASGEDTYKLSAVVDGVTKYLKVGSAGLSLVDEAEASAVQFIPGSGTHAKEFRLAADGKAVSYEGTNGYKTADDNSGAAKEYLRFVSRSNYTEEDFIIYSASKVSVSDPGVTNGSRVIVYTRTWNEDDKRYEFYAIDHDGSLVRCYEKGDSIEWIGSRLNSLLWNFTEYYWEGTNDPNYYYELKNPYSGNYLAPQIGGQTMSTEPIGINMNGRRYGDYYSNIIAWDDPYYAYAGLKVEDGKIVSCPFAEAGDFYFAIMQDPPEAGELTTVPTVDHEAHGITMRMVDFNGPLVKVGQTTTTQQQHGVMGDSNYVEREGVPGLLSTQLDPVTGYPVAALTGRSLGELFEADDAKDVNHLFIDSIYSGTGYFEYDSTQNYAYLDGNDFVVYKELGTIDSGTSPTRKHGQFLPYNNLDPNKLASVNSMNLYDAEQNLLDDSDPRKYEQLYLVSNPDYYFGMEIEASFVQTPNGQDAWGHDIIYEFTGDDDFWLYVDGELVIDLGGIHSALPGTVNFCTGEVRVRNTHTTLKDIFENNYRNRGMAESEIAQKIDELFVLNASGQYVFRDYTTHTMKIFFMERGAGASNLHMRFNLSSVRPGQVMLKKEISGTDKPDYKLAEYAYQIWYETEVQTGDTEPGDDSTGEAQTEWKRLNPQTITDSHINVEYANTNIPVTYKETFTPPGSSVEYEDVYFLSPEQTILINVPEDTIRYKIVECGVNTQVYDQVQVNDETVTGTDTSDAGRKDFWTSPASVADRKRVVFDNHVNPNALRPLTITKKLYDIDGNLITDDPTGFGFRLYLGNENNPDPVLASLQDYCVKNADNEYCTWDAGRQCFATTGVTDYDSFSDAQKQAVTFHTSMNGTISKIPAEYKVEVRDLLVGTRFRVEERMGDIPPGYAFIEYERDASSYIVEQGDSVNAGIIRDNDSPAIEVHNRRGFGLTVKKVWSDASFMDGHGDIFTAVYVDGDLLDGSVRRIHHPATSAYYYWDQLQEETTLESYAIREVVMNGPYSVNESTNVVTPDAGTTVVPLENGNTLSIRAKSKQDDQEKDYDYSVTYTEGDIAGAADNIRTDTITNSRHGIRLVKTDWAGNALPGAVFSLTDVAGQTVGSGEYTSDEEGLITIAYVNVDTVYTLTETKTPDGYHALEEPLQFKLQTNGTRSTVYARKGDGGWVSATTGHALETAEFIVTQETGDTMACITVKNRTYDLRAVKVKEADSGDGSTEPLAGAHFALYYEHTVDGYSRFIPMGDGYDDLISEDVTGIIPGITKDLAAGTYELRETAAPEGYDELTAPIRFTITETGMVVLEASSGGQIPTGITLDAALLQDGTKQYTLTVSNGKAAVPVILRKVGVDNATGAVVDEKLGGAVFTIYTNAAHTEKARGKTGSEGTEIVLENLSSSDTDGVFFDGTLAPGIYYLSETSIPDGYFKMAEDVIIQVESEGVSIFRNGVFEPVETGDSGAGTGEAVTVRVENYSGYALPSAGGPGTTLLRVLGIILTGIAGACLVVRRRRRAA